MITKTKKKVAKKAKKKTPKEATHVFLVIYDLMYGNDPVQKCKSLEEARDVVSKMIETGEDKDGDEVTKSSIRVYEADLIGKPVVEITFTK